MPNKRGGGASGEGTTHGETFALLFALGDRYYEVEHGGSRMAGGGAQVIEDRAKTNFRTGSSSFTLLHSSSPLHSPWFSGFNEFLERFCTFPYFRFDLRLRILSSSFVASLEIGRRRCTIQYDQRFHDYIRRSVAILKSAYGKYSRNPILNETLGTLTAITSRL